jgi:hypothetical protein
MACVSECRHDPVRVMALFKVLGEDANKFVPPFLAEFGVKRGASDHGELLRFGGQKDEQAIFLGGCLQVKFLKFEMRGGEGVFYGAVGDIEYDVRRGSAFGGLDGAANPFVFDGI